MPNNENAKKLKELKKNLLSIIKEYNKLASKQDLDSRVALISAEASFDTDSTQNELDDGVQARPKNINKYFKENGPYEAPVYYDVKDDTGWFPSSICIRY